MTLIKLPVSPPFVRVVGDEFRVAGDQVEQWRGNVKVAHRTIDLEHAVKITDPATVGPNVIDTLILELPMPAYEITVTSVSYAEDGVVTVNFSDSTSQEFNDRAAIANFANELDDLTVAKKALIRAWGHKSSDYSDPSWVQDRTARLDLSNQLTPLEFA